MLLRAFGLKFFPMKINDGPPKLKFHTIDHDLSYTKYLGTKNNEFLR